MGISEQTPEADSIEPEWFKKWRKGEEKRRARHELKDTGFNVFVVGLGVIAIGLGMAALEGMNEIAVAQVIMTGIAVTILGVVVVFLSRWAAVRGG